VIWCPVDDRKGDGDEALALVLAIVGIAVRRDSDGGLPQIERSSKLTDLCIIPYRPSSNNSKLPRTAGRKHLGASTSAAYRSR
jgi:hypothetical protein